MATFLLQIKKSMQDVEGREVKCETEEEPEWESPSVVDLVRQYELKLRKARENSEASFVNQGSNHICDKKENIIVKEYSADEKMGIFQSKRKTIDCGCDVNDRVFVLSDKEDHQEEGVVCLSEVRNSRETFPCKTEEHVNEIIQCKYICGLKKCARAIDKTSVLEEGYWNPVSEGEVIEPEQCQSGKYPERTHVTGDPKIPEHCVQECESYSVRYRQLDRVKSGTEAKVLGRVSGRKSRTTSLNLFRDLYRVSRNSQWLGVVTEERNNDFRTPFVRRERRQEEDFEEWDRREGVSSQKFQAESRESVRNKNDVVDSQDTNFPDEKKEEHSDSKFLYILSSLRIWLLRKSSVLFNRGQVLVRQSSAYLSRRCRPSRKSFAHGPLREETEEVVKEKPESGGKVADEERKELEESPGGKEEENKLPLRPLNNSFKKSSTLNISMLPRWSLLMEELHNDASDEDEDEILEDVCLRVRDRPLPRLQLLHDRPVTFQWDSVRPKTLMFGVCTKTQFFSESFGDGVSESETEDEDDPHHVESRGGGGRRDGDVVLGGDRERGDRGGGRPMSICSDMEVESKRNSQAVSTEPSEFDEQSSVPSDLEDFYPVGSFMSSEPTPPPSRHFIPPSCTSTTQTSLPPPMPSSSFSSSSSSPTPSTVVTPSESALVDNRALVTSQQQQQQQQQQQEFKQDRCFKIAMELLQTERKYVQVLHLIDQEFQFRVDNENRAHPMFPQEVLPQMFSNVKSIYKLHHDFLMPQLEDRMVQWQHHNRIGDIMKNFAPFLKMYTEYVRNFDNAMNLINQWQAKCPRFAAIMAEIQQSEASGHLSLQHHMLSPVQRIPRYELLLKDYLKKLPEDSPDRDNTERALNLVSMAANHANDAMKKIDKFEKLLEIQESLGGAVDLVSPTRELVKEGKIIKISARSGDHQERYLFLLTDLLLLCSPRLMGARVMSGPQYRLRARYNVENLQVLEGDNLETANTFYIRDTNKTVELYTQTIDEKEAWLKALFRAIQETYQRKSSLKLHLNPEQKAMDADLGQKQPTLVRMDSVSKCMECSHQFTMVRRKHHCRACGAVVCSKCSGYKVSLACASGKSVRVCGSCYTALQELASTAATPTSEGEDENTDINSHSIRNSKDSLDLSFRARGVLEVSAKTQGAVTQGFLQLKTHRKSWVKRWFALHRDFVLYSFKTEMDDLALTATPVPGFTVVALQGAKSDSGIGEKERQRCFRLHHCKKQYIFQAASRDECERWVTALQKASRAELPSPVQ